MFVEDQQALDVTDHPKKMMNFITGTWLKVYYVIFLAFFRDSLTWVCHNKRNFRVWYTSCQLIVKFLRFSLRKDGADVVNHLHFLVFFGSFLLDWRRHKFCYHLSILFYLHLLGVSTFDRLTLGWFILLFQILCLVIVASTLLEVDIQLLYYCPNGWCFANSRSASYDQSEKLPLIFPDILVNFIGLLGRELAEKAVFFYYFIFVLKKCEEPLFDFFTCLDIEKLRYLFGSIFVAPKTMGIWLQMFSENASHDIFRERRFFCKYSHELLQFGAFLESLL